LKGDSVEVARIKLRLAEMEFKAIKNKYDSGVASPDEYARAELARDLAAIYLKQAERKTK
jgi:outer membrane protein TolC